MQQALDDNVYLGGHEMCQCNADDVRVEVQGRQLRIAGLRFPPPQPQLHPPDILFSSELLGEILAPAATRLGRPCHAVPDVHLACQWLLWLQDMTLEWPLCFCARSPLNTVHVNDPWQMLQSVVCHNKTALITSGVFYRVWAHAEAG